MEPAKSLAIPSATISSIRTVPMFQPRKEIGISMSRGFSRTETRALPFPIPPRIGLQADTCDELERMSASRIDTTPSTASSSDRPVSAPIPKHSHDHRTSFASIENDDVDSRPSPVPAKNLGASVDVWRCVETLQSCLEDKLIVHILGRGCKIG